MKNKFTELLKSTNIDGIDNLINHLEKNGFFVSPASAGHHMSKDGGLLEHSLNVYNVAAEFGKTNLVDGIIEDNDLIIACLLHDVGKMGAFGEPNYIPNILKSGNRSDKKPWITTRIGIEHQDLSLMIVNRFIELNREQAIAIKYHNGLYTPDGRDIKGNETPLYLIVHFADMWASRIIE